MAFRQWIWSGLFAAGIAMTSGCSVQDPEQPAVGSISVQANKDDDDAGLVLGKAKTKKKAASANRD